MRSEDARTLVLGCVSGYKSLRWSFWLFPLLLLLGRKVPNAGWVSGCLFQKVLLESGIILSSKICSCDAEKAV